MANGRMSNSELSDSIKNYIKDMFDTNIKASIEQHNTIIIDLKDTILDLQTQIKNNNNHNDSNTILYSSMVAKNLDEIKCTINDTVTKNIENIYEDSNRKKTFIIYNIEEKKFNKKIDKFKYDKDSINIIISEISDVENISIQNIHRIGKINIDSETNEIINDTIRPIKITLNTELDKMHILNMYIYTKRIDHLKIKKRGGGVAFFVKKMYKSSIIDNLSISITDSIDIVSIQIIDDKSKKHNILSAIYRSPDSDTTLFNDLIFNLFLNYINKDIFLCGDFNIDFSKNSNTTKNFNYILTQLGLSSIINIYTVRNKWYNID